ncbi:hypothetical protein [Asticcacaulis solisilvae]|uniref:hypothetical protein n=1 Tax=Asticcacaulis solisilvae TaxID=1217274 RepID=UPI003FD8A9ED
MKAVLFAGVVLGCLGITGSAEAYVSFCSAPTPPSSFDKPRLPTKPTKPYCLSSYTGKSTCSDWEIRSYNDSVDQYNNALERYKSERRDYVDRLQRYLDDAQRYAVCEVKALDD